MSSGDTTRILGPGGKGEILRAIGELKDDMKERHDRLDTKVDGISQKMEKTITKVEVQEVKCAATQKDLDDHKEQHLEARKWWWGIGGTAIFGAVGAAYEWLKSIGMK